jgi:hypothetical protein
MGVSVLAPDCPTRDGSVIGVTEIAAPAAYGRVVTLFRLISPGTRSALMIAAGSAMIVLPLALGLSSAALVTSLAVGALMVGLGIAGTASDGRGTLPISAHAAYDRGLALGLLLAAVLFGAVGAEPGALAFFAAAGAFQLFVGVSTRYSTRPAAI